MDIFDELEKGKYGSFELKKMVGRNLLRGLAFSIIIHSVVIAAPWIVTFFKGEEDIPKNIMVLDPSILKKLKQLDPNKKPPKLERPKLAPPKVVVPIAVKEEEIPEEQPEIMKQEDLVEAITQDYDTSGLDIGEDVVFTEEVPDYGTFIAYEIAPAPLPDFSPQPEFPEMAQKAGVAGKVTAQVFVDKDGSVKKWRIVQARPEGLGFEQEVEKVIPKWKFTPAIQQGNPVGVWIAIPFNFKVK